ncbi:flavin reductase [Clostridium intestinale]|uniref:Flavin reductase like domain-containing protein n=1 Tax=Clostridium intestinale URNW TaxID=1294142 RepID=U2PV95_9CLOT|nr:flavin reductase [Clostridium intestinale]ERK30370.1 hypothetical protein CINTURNW_1217 [Clostridium intestinale URNW]
MSTFVEIKPEELTENPFKLIGSDWTLITAEKEGKVNTMTASWGGLGIMWGKPAAYIFIRPHRYTKEFVDASDTFSLTFFDNSFKKQLGYLGSTSGRDEDKISKSNLTITHEGSTPYFEEAKLTVICKKLYAQELSPKSFSVDGFDDKFYQDKDYHTMYIAEVQKVLLKQ